MLELKLSVSIGDDVNDFCIEAMTAGCKKPRLYHATVETTWACFGETFWREHMDVRSKLRQQLAPLVRGEVSRQISSVYVSEETASQLRMVTETGFLEPKIAKMVLNPDPEHRRGEHIPDNETIYDTLDIKPTIIAAIGNFKIARKLLHSSLRDGAPDLFAKLEKMSR